MSRHPIRIQALALLLAVALWGCGSDAQTPTDGQDPPEAQLSQAEAEAVSQELTAASLDALDYAFGRAFTIRDATPVSSNVPVGIRIEFEVVRACPLDGRIVVTGGFEGEFDREEHRGRFNLGATKVIDFCQFPQDDVVLTVYTEEPHITIAAASEHDGPFFESELHIQGALNIETNDGRAARCEIELWIYRRHSEDGSEFHRTEGHVCTRDVGGEDGNE